MDVLNVTTGTAQSKSPSSVAAKRNRQLYQNIIGNKWETHRRNQQKWLEFSLGEQMTKTEKEQLERVGMPTFIVNRVTPAIETLRYFVSANNPKPAAVGREGSDVDKASVVNGLFEYCWDVSSGRSVFSQIVRDALSVGCGYWHVYFDPSSDDGMGDVKFGYIPWTDVYVDPSSTDVYFRDAEYIIVKKDIKRATLANELPDYKNIIMRTACNDERSYSYSDRDTYDSYAVFPADISTMEAVDGQEQGAEDVVDYYEGYYRTRSKFWNVSMRVMPSKEQMQAIVQRVDADTAVYAQGLQDEIASNAIELGDSLKNGSISQERHDFELQRLQKGFQNMVAQYRQELLTKEVEAISEITTNIMSDKDYKLIMSAQPTREAVIEAVPFWKRQVVVVVSIGDQTMLHKYTLDIDEIPIVPLPYIHTGTPYCLSAVSMVVGQQEEINKAHQLMIYNTSLGASLRFWYYQGSIDAATWKNNLFMPGALLPVNPGAPAPPGIIQPISLPNAFLEIVQLGGQYIDDTLGASAVAQGKASPSETPYRGLVAMDEFGTRRIKNWVLNVVDPCLEYLAKVWLPYAKLMYKSKKVFRIVNPDDKKVKEFKLNVPVYNDYGELAGRWNGLDEHKYDIKFVSGGTLPSNRWAKSQEYMELFKLGIIDDVAAVAELDITGKEALLQRKSLYVQLQQQMQSMDAEIKRLKGTNETLERQLVQSGIVSKIQEANVEIRSNVADQKAAMEVERQSLKANVNNTLTNVQADAELARQRMGDLLKEKRKEV